MKNTKQTGRVKKRPAGPKEEAVNHLFGLLEEFRGEADDSLIDELQRHLFTLTNPFSSHFSNWSRRLKDRHTVSVKGPAGSGQNSSGT